MRKNVVKNLIKKAIEKAGTIRNLAKRVNIPKSTLFNNYSEQKKINSKNLEVIEDYIEIFVKEEDIINKFPDNWRQINGGKNCVAKKREQGTLNRQLEEARRKMRKDGKSASDWHKMMKRDNPEAYYLMQYEKFKKVGNYKFITKKGEKVRNILEKESADFLFSKNINYQYEPLVKADGRYFFPDFLIRGKIIIECTMWRGFDKAIKLKDKIKHLEKEYKVYVLIPKALNNYYKILNNHLIFKLNEKDLIAQPVEHLTVKT